MEHREMVRERAEYERKIEELREQRDLETKRVHAVAGALRAEHEETLRRLASAEQIAHAQADERMKAYEESADLRTKLAEAEERARRAEEPIGARKLGALLDVASAARVRVGYCECDWETTGHTGACRDLQFALCRLDNAEEAQAPSGEPLSARQAAVAAKMRERATPTTSMLATTTQAPSGEPAKPSRVVASTGAEPRPDGNVTVGVTAHCACGRVFVDDVVAGLAKTTEHAPVIVCGTKPEGYDVTAKSVNGRCPHCWAIGRLETGYGLAAGGCGSYRICMACERVCDSVQDEDDAPSGEPTPVEASEPEAIATLRAWCAIDPAERGDAAAWEIVADAHDTVEAASKMLDAAPEVLRLYDVARAEVAALTARALAEAPNHTRAAQVSVEDAPPETQDAMMAPWRAVPREDEKGRWVLK